MTDPYEILSVGPETSDEQIRQRYLELVRQNPPDRSPQRFAEVRRAYEQLRDPVARLEKKLFSTTTSDTMAAIMADVKQRLRRTRIPTQELLSLTGQS